MNGKALVTALLPGVVSPRPPYIPILGRLAHLLGQVTEQVFTTDPQVQATVLMEVATALRADAITVGVGSSPAVGAEVVTRLRPLLQGRALVGCLAEADVAGAREYCEAGVDMILLLAPDRSNTGRFRTLSNACSFYRVPSILLDPATDELAVVATELGLHGAIVAKPSGQEPGIVGGGLSVESMAGGNLVVPRRSGFFWTFPDEAPSGVTPEDLVALGSRLVT
jgi:small ligand-binding sensory domain FIST